jgi:hypothetical protein
MKKCLFAILFIVSFSSINYLYASDKNDKSIQRNVDVYELRKSNVGSIEYYSTNYGLINLNVRANSGGLFWPRGSGNQYGFAGGIWFAAKKKGPGTDTLRKYVAIGYNPNNGRSWFVPGQIDDGDTLIPNLKRLYRLYFSTDYDRDGQAKDPADGPAWPLWWVDSVNKYLQWTICAVNYESDSTKRNLLHHPLGTYNHGDEEVFASYKDTDLRRYDGGAEKRKKMGYPLGLQFNQYIRTWREDSSMMITYLITNKSKDTLRDCYFGSIHDIDIYNINDSPSGSSNDRFNFYSKKDDAIMFSFTNSIAYAWTETTMGEAGKHFGYTAISFLETPGLDENGYALDDTHVTLPDKQLWMSSCRFWNVANDIIGDKARYDFISSKRFDKDIGAGDKRIMINSGPFDFLPGTTVRFSVLITFAMPCKGGEADGTIEDINCEESGLIAQVRERVARHYFKLFHTAVENNNNDNDNDNDVHISPNPATNYVDIRTKDVMLSEAKHPFHSVKIYDVLGNVVLSSLANFVGTPSEGGHIKLDVSRLTAGVYFVKIDNKMYKFVKM